MIYDIHHVTIYSYETRVASTRCAIRLTPRGGRDQRVLRARIEASPFPEYTRESLDFFGNRIIEATVREAHARLRITLSARVEVEREEPPAAGLTPAWETIARAASAIKTLSRESPAHWLFPSRQAPLYAPATDYARKSFPPGRPVLEGAEDLMRRIKADFAYDPHATHVATPLAEAFETRGGVCQDFAHIMIASLRGLAIPAAYVSGYIRTMPAPGQPRLDGADASHAWVAVWCGEPFGWIHLDPTNAMHADDNHIVVAVGRDYADVAPIDGVVVGSGRQALSVSVDIRAVSGLQ